MIETSAHLIVVRGSEQQLIADTGDMIDSKLLSDLIQGACAQDPLISAELPGFTLSLPIMHSSQMLEIDELDRLVAMCADADAPTVIAHRLLTTNALTFELSKRVSTEAFVMSGALKHNKLADPAVAKSIGASLIEACKAPAGVYSVRPDSAGRDLHLLSVGP